MKIFKRKKKETIQDPINYIKKERNHHFFFASSLKKPQIKLSPKQKKITRYATLVALPVVAIALGATLGIVANINNQTNDGLVNQVIVDTNVSQRRIYLISDDNYTIPLTVNLNKKNNIHEEMLDVINLLKVSSKASNEYLHGFIKDEAKVNSFSTDESNNLTVDFSKDFFCDDGVSQNTKIDALVSSLLQFDTVNSVTITSESQIYKTKQTEPRLNKIISNTSLLENQELVTVFYQRQYDQNHKYLIPVSLYTAVGESDNITFVNGLFKQLPSKYFLKNLDVYDCISKKQSKKNDFSLTVNTKALVDEETVNKELYEIVLLSLDLMGKEEKVSFDLEGETLMVEGIYQEEDLAVSSIQYNEIQI